MATKEQTQHNIDRLRHPRSLSLPLVGRKINVPDQAALTWYAGLGTMAALELIEWPVALLIAGTHFIENHSHNRDIQQLAEGVDAGA